MGEKEKNVIKKLKEVYPEMDEFDKGYMLGMIERNALEIKITMNRYVHTTEDHKRREMMKLERAASAFS